MPRLCTICARGGSKGVPDKNIRMIAGKPLIAHSVEQALATGLFQAVAISSDSPQILAAAAAAGAHCLIERPNELATDSAPKLPVMLHALEQTEARLGTRFDILVDLDATSPLRLPADILGVVELLERTAVSNVITGAPARRSPYFNLVERGPDGVARLSKPPAGTVARRQDAPPCFDMNASIYGWRTDRFRVAPAVFNADTLLYEMPEERSVDIDHELDVAIVELLFARRSGGL
jgi:N-acylneuraminate cytidylyltransferase/CMP-N,N'-diacetyllegionaminic acid synthase